MRPQTFRAFLERLSFFLWIMFTIMAISLAGVGLEGMIVYIFSIFPSGARLANSSGAMIIFGVLGVFVSMLWRQVGVDRLHYPQHDSEMSFGEESDAPSTILKDLIEEVESSSGNARTDARGKARAWLVAHVSSLTEEDIGLAKTHFGYLLPADWGK